MSTKKLIGLYGGAFDPVHNAHIEIAKNCINEVGLAKLILIPTPGQTEQILLGKIWQEKKMGTLL